MDYNFLVGFIKQALDYGYDEKEVVQIVKLADNILKIPNFGVVGRTPAAPASSAAPGAPAKPMAMPIQQQMAARPRTTTMTQTPYGVVGSNLNGAASRVNTMSQTPSFGAGSPRAMMAQSVQQRQAAQRVQPQRIGPAGLPRLATQMQPRMNFAANAQSRPLGGRGLQTGSGLQMGKGLQAGGGLRGGGLASTGLRGGKL